MAEALPFGALLRHHRLAVGLTQKELAERAGLSARAISDLERGVKTRPYRHTVQLLAAALALSGEQWAGLLTAARPGALAPPERGPDQAAALPTGTLTFLLTDIEGSTPLWERHPAAMQAAIARHDALIDATLARHGGLQVKERGEGDSVLAVFTSPAAAVVAACALQQALRAEPWPAATPLRVRIGLHTGEAALRGIDYYGVTVNRTARIRSLAHGEQILLSQATAELVRGALPAGVQLRALGRHQLKGFAQPEALWQVVHPALPTAFPPLPSAQAPPTNLPAALTSFIGREREHAEVAALLHGARLVTLTGAGGAGKTRLALATSRALLSEYPDGAWLVELAPLADPALVVQAVAQTLGLREEASRPLLDTLLAHLEHKHLLLVLDNCEHLVDACAELAAELLRWCPLLRILATSREGLGVAGERLYRVPALAVPPLDPLPVPEELGGYAAMALFVARAQERQAAFALTAQNARPIAQICTRLDGLPLALELAAARVAHLPVEAIAARLDDRFRLLTGGPRTAVPRQQTLRAALDWSYELLTEGEQRLLERLSVFAGGWTLDAAEEVCSGDGIEAREVLDLLASLVNKSLVVLEGTGTQGVRAQYRLLETVRQYGQERLDAAAKTAAVRDRHVAWCLAMAEEAKPELFGPQGVAWLDRLEGEHDNLRAALRWCIEGARVEEGMRLASALGYLWYSRGHATEGLAKMKALLALPASVPLAAPRAELLTGAAHLARVQGDFATGRLFLEESIGLYRGLSDVRGLASALFTAGFLARMHEEYRTARTLLEEALALSRASEDTLNTAHALHHLGMIAVEFQEDYAAARSLLEESLALYRTLGAGRGAALVLCGLGNVARAESRHAAAHDLLREGLTMLRQRGDIQALPSALDRIAHLASDAGQRERAVRLAGAAARLRETLGTLPPPVLQRQRERWLPLARAILGDPLYVAAWEAGQALSLEQAIAEALAEPPAVPVAPGALAPPGSASGAV